MKEKKVVERLTALVCTIEERVSLTTSFFINPDMPANAGPCALIYIAPCHPELHEQTVEWLSLEHNEHFIFFLEHGLGVISVWPREAIS